MSIRNVVLCSILPTFCIFLSSCGDSGGTAAVQPGTPAFFWSTAKQSWQNGDYTRTADNLSKLTTSDNEYKTRAQAWLMLVSAGVAQGYMEQADVFDAAARTAKNPLAFRKQASLARNGAKSSTLQFVEMTHEFMAKSKDEMVDLDFGFPTGSMNDSPVFAKVAKGIMPQDSELEGGQKASLQKGVIEVACRMVGAADDSAKAIGLFKQPPVKVPRATFMMAVARTLHDQSAMFGPKQLDEPQRAKMLCTEAQEALKVVPASKETKELQIKLDKTMKPLKTT